MKTLLKILVTIVALFVVVGLLLPSHAHVERSITINASAEKIFPYINSLRMFNRWSPWYERDQDATYEFSGPDSGVGMKMNWFSEQRDVGSGSQEIIASKLNESVKTALDFGEMGQAIAEFRIRQEAAGSVVTWSFDEDISWNPIHRWFGLFLEKLLGPDYEAGLSNLKQLVESEHPPGEA